MTAQQQVARAHLDTQAFALMSRLHVILRRECGRITDIEYMRQNPGYCEHVLDLAARMPTDTLPEICARLREIFFGEQGLFVVTPAAPLLGPRAPLVSNVGAGMTGTTGATGTAAAAAQAAVRTADVAQEPVAHAAPVEQAYVGRLR